MSSLEAGLRLLVYVGGALLLIGAAAAGFAWFSITDDEERNV